MFRRQPFVIHVGVGEFDILITHRVVELHEDSNFFVIDTRARLFFYADLQRHVLLRVWIRGLNGFDFSDTHDRAFRVAANISVFCCVS